tara:strand:+ start:133 stop:246 length:114 start_codon:yes stop_codon:yes gene_type:complete
MATEIESAGIAGIIEERLNEGSSNGGNLNPQRKEDIS